MVEKSKTYHNVHNPIFVFLYVWGVTESMKHAISRLCASNCGKTIKVQDHHDRMMALKLGTKRETPLLGGFLFL